MKNSTSLQLEQAETYLHLLKRTLTRCPLELVERLMLTALRDMEPALTNKIAHWGIASASLNRGPGFNRILHSVGMEWPREVETMIGLRRLDNVEHCVRSVLQRNVPGDLMETGVWRGGAAILMRAVLKAYGDTDRKVWLADSFQGLPKPDAQAYPADRYDIFWRFPQLAVSLETVKANFTAYGLLDEQVRFLPGWFRDTLPAAPLDALAVLRLDGDMYESTIVALRSLYHRVSPGGFVIIDDYGYIPACRQAVTDFRDEENIVESLLQIDWNGVYWQVSESAQAEAKRRRDLTNVPKVNGKMNRERTGVGGSPSDGM
jgi:O-methyltransferase